MRIQIIEIYGIISLTRRQRLIVQAKVRDYDRIRSKPSAENHILKSPEENDRQFQE